MSVEIATSLQRTAIGTRVIATATCGAHTYELYKDVRSHQSVEHVREALADKLLKLISKERIQ
jgi:hypothetical protein